MRLFKAFLALLPAVLVTTEGWGAPITYDYVGRDFNAVTGTPIAGLGDHISGSVTFSGPLAPLTEYTLSDIAAWAFSDGHVTLSSDTNFLQGGGIRTGGSGEILYWLFEASYSSSQAFPQLYTENWNIIIDSSANPSVFHVAYVYGNGQWSSADSPVPEPGTLVLALFGLVVVALSRQFPRPLKF
jgi:hypothetical protein